MEMKNIRGFFVGMFLLIAGCAYPVSEVDITAKIPAGSRNIASETTPTATESMSHARGFFLEKNMVLTVAHAVPNGAKLDSDFLEKKRDDTADLLLLTSQTPGTPLILTENNPSLGTEIFDCEHEWFRGKIKSITSTVAENAFGDTALLENLFFVHGDFYSGESGKPFCDQNRKVLGILVAIRGNDGFLRGAKEIKKFLEK